MDNIPIGNQKNLSCFSFLSSNKINLYIIYSYKMTDTLEWDRDDSITKLNTQINKSMVLMDSINDSNYQQNRSNRSIKINTKIQPPSVKQKTSRKSILKKSRTINEEDTNANCEIDESDMQSVDTTSIETKLTIECLPKPCNLAEFLQHELLVPDKTSLVANLDLSDSEEVWMMDIPKTVDPRELKGQTITLGDKTKFKINNEKYCTVNYNTKSDVISVLRTRSAKSKYKAVNIRLKGVTSLRRKLSNIPKPLPMILDKTVPYPTNLKRRHPLFGATHDDIVKKEEKIM